MFERESGFMSSENGQDSTDGRDMCIGLGN